MWKLLVLVVTLLVGLTNAQQQQENMNGNFNPSTTMNNNKAISFPFISSVGASRPSPPTAHPFEDLQNKVQTAASSTASTMLGSLSTMGSRAAGASHTLFVPPYSWMWRAGMQMASLKYDKVGYVADVPELMNMITGYYAGSPEALEAARKADRPGDPFSLHNLAQIFPGSAADKAEALKKGAPMPTTSQQGHVTPSAAAQQHSTSSMLGSVWNPFGSTPPTPVTKTTMANKRLGFQTTSNRGDYDEDSDSDDDAVVVQKDQGFMASLMNGLTGSPPPPHHAMTPAKHVMYSSKSRVAVKNEEDNGLMSSVFNMLGGDNTPAPTMAQQQQQQPSHHKAHQQQQQGGFEQMMLNALAGGNGGQKKNNNDMTSQMIKFAAPMLGVDPNMATMAAPLINSMM